MATELLKISANFETTLASKLSTSGTSATLTSATDKDGIALPSGSYGFTLDEGESTEEHITADLASTALTNIKTVARTAGTGVAGATKLHRIGSSVKITNFPILRRVTDLLDGTTDFDSATPLKYDGNPTISTDADIVTKKYADDQDETLLDLAGTRVMTGTLDTNGNTIDMNTAKIVNLDTPTDNTDAATKAYVDGVVTGGAPDANETTKGLVEIATQAEMTAGTDTGSTGALLVPTPSKINTTVDAKIAAAVYSHAFGVATSLGGNTQGGFSYVLSNNAIITGQTNGSSGNMTVGGLTVGNDTNGGSNRIFIMGGAGETLSGSHVGSIVARYFE